MSDCNNKCKEYESNPDNEKKFKKKRSDIIYLLNKGKSSKPDTMTKYNILIDEKTKNIIKLYAYLIYLFSLLVPDVTNKESKIRDIKYRYLFWLLFSHFQGVLFYLISLRKYFFDSMTR